MRNKAEKLTFKTKVNTVINSDKDIVTKKIAIIQDFESLNEDKKS